MLALLFLAVAAGGHGAAVLVRRSSVPLVSALALVRSRRLVRERVPLLLRPQHRAVGAGITKRSSTVKRPPAAASITARSAARILWSPFYAASPHLWTRATGGVADGFSRLTSARWRTGRRSTAFSPSCCLFAPREIVRWARLWPPSDWLDVLGRPRGLAWDAAALLHVRRAAVLARGVGVRRGAVRDGVAARPAGVDALAAPSLLGVCAALMAMISEQDIFHRARRRSSISASLC